MGLSVTISLDVPDLPDNDIWFANAAAWKAYWGDINITAVFNSLNNALYVEGAYNYTIPAPTVTANDGADYSFATSSMIESVLAKLDTLNTNYKTLRNELKAAGLLQNSQ